MHTNYINKCVNINNCLTEAIKNMNFPREIINIIIDIIWNLRSEPVIISFIQRNTIPIATILSGWLNKENIFKPHFDKIYPKLRYGMIHDTKDKTESDIIYPKSLSPYLFVDGYHMVLIPGILWDQALISNDEIVDGVQVLDCALIYTSKYANRYIDIFTNWLQEAIINPDFLRVQNQI